MKIIPRVFLGMVCVTALSAQTVEELVNRNLAARGGLGKLKAIRSLRMTGKAQQGGLLVPITQDSKAPNLLRQSATIQGMTLIQAYDGSVGWQISPFSGRKDAELIGEDDLRDLQEDADFDGALVDNQAKGNRIEFAGHDTVDGDDALRLKVTLKNGDILYYYLDPETFLEIRIERIQFIHGSVRETFTQMGSYKLVDGVYFPFSTETGSLRNPSSVVRYKYDKIEANVPMDGSEFKMPAALQEKK